MFNIETFDIKLETDFIGRNFVYTESIQSTNTYFVNNSDKLNNGTTVLTEYQEEGRGRFLRPWESNKGENLTFSILLNKKISKINPNHINLAASLSVSAAIENLFQLKTTLKWPNDVLINNKKVSGILLESSSYGSKLEKIIIGIGVNVNQTKFLGDYKIQPTSVKFELKKEIKRERLLSEILNVFEGLLINLQDSPKKILDEWREKCRMIGEPISIIIGDIKKYGTFYDIDANGFMILKTGNDFEKITNGDVYFR